MRDKSYLELLKESFPTRQAAATEIVNLKAILQLPKGTEHFMSDLHGEYASFRHIMNNCSGVIREKVELSFPELTQAERDELTTLVYYPEYAIRKQKQTKGEQSDWLRQTLYRLLVLCRRVASKYTRSKVRKAMPKQFGYILDELIHTDRSDFNKEEYYDEIFGSLIEVGQAEACIVTLCSLAKDLAVDHLHIVGDIFDRGERPDLILDLLCRHHSADLQWGNHDVLWMGAAMGGAAHVAGAVELSLKYGNADLLEHGYGIPLRELATFAEKTYGYDPRFAPPDRSENTVQLAKMHKAAFVLRMKAEGKIYLDNPRFACQERALLRYIDFEKQQLVLDKTYDLTACDFPTCDPNDPLKLTDEEEKTLLGMTRGFTDSEKLRRHLVFMMQKGSIYKIYNGNLIFHGCIPLTDTGDYAGFPTERGEVKGRAFLDYAEATVRAAYASYCLGKSNPAAMDFIWYLWCGKLSPLYGRDRMTTFERLFIQDPTSHVETKNAYYTYCEREDFCTKLLADFHLDGKYCHIVNGHVPVLSREGQSPIRAGGKLIVIDGGFCRAYQPKTGIAGYTLIYNSYGLRLAAHEPFAGKPGEGAGGDIHSEVTVFERREARIKVGDTDVGKKLKERISDLKELLTAYDL